MPPVSSEEAGVTAGWAGAIAQPARMSEDFGVKQNAPLEAGETVQPMQVRLGAPTKSCILKRPLLLCRKPSGSAALVSTIYLEVC